MEQVLNRNDGTSPASSVFQITRGDTSAANFTVTRGLAWVGAGDVKVTTADNEDVVITDGVLSPGVIHPLRVIRVWSTGTTPTVFVGFR